jgi:hypothetical protein
MAIPPSHNPSSLNSFPLGRFKPSKIYRRRPPLKSPIVKNIFHDTLPLVPMAHTWEKDLYKPINMATIHGYPNTMPKESNKWFPNFPGNNVVTADDHVYAMSQDIENAEVEHEDVEMKLLASSLTEYAHRWFKYLLDNHIASYEDFAKLFKKMWTTKKYNTMLLAQFNQIKNKENEK